MSNEIVEYKNEFVPTEKMLNALMFMAKQAANSKFYEKVGGEAGILSIMLLARELDVPPMQALSGGIWNIQGKVEMSARMMNMKIRQGGHKLKIEHGNDFCSITGCRKDTGEELQITYSMKDAERAGLTNKDNWKKDPRSQLFARAISILARQLFPDVIGNCYVEDEVRNEFDKDDKDKKSNKDENKTAISYEAMEIIPANSRDGQAKMFSLKQEASVDEIPIEDLPYISIDTEGPYITPAQTKELGDLLADHPDRMQKMLEKYNIPIPSLLPAHLFDEAIQVARSKKK